MAYRGRGRGRGRGNYPNQSYQPAQTSYDTYPDQSRHNHHSIDNRQGATIDLAVRGWTSSTYSQTQDRGISELLKYMERGATKDNRAKPIHSWKLVGRAQTVLIITVDQRDASRYKWYNNRVWSDATLIVEDSRVQSSGQREGDLVMDAPNGARSQTHPNMGNVPRPGERGKPIPGNDDLINAILAQRFNVDTKLLDLSNLNSIPQFTESALVRTNTYVDIWATIFDVCNKAKTSPDQIISVSLKNNNVENVHQVYTLANVFPLLKNLDLSDNKLEDISRVSGWSRRFKDLELLVLSGNPLVNHKDIASNVREMQKWWPKAKIDISGPGAGAPPAAPAAPTAPTAALVPSLEFDRPTSQLGHPELPPDTTFAMPAPGKPEEVLIREKMALKLSFETKLKIAACEEALVALNWDFLAALNAFNQAKATGQVDPSKLLQV